MQGATDRRKWQRLPLRVPVFVQLNNGTEPNPMEFGAALNIGPGGALLHTRSFLPVNSGVVLSVPLSPALGGEHREQRIHATVLRFMPRGRGFDIAVQFVNPLIGSPE
jgi:hypothetical protein